MILPVARFSAVFNAPKAPVLTPTVSALLIMLAVRDVSTPRLILLIAVDTFVNVIY
jgi:hypothetical protein